MKKMIFLLFTILSINSYAGTVTVTKTVNGKKEGVSIYILPDGSSHSFINCDETPSATCYTETTTTTTGSIQVGDPTKLDIYGDFGQIEQTLNGGWYSYSTTTNDNITTHEYVLTTIAN